ncbi:carbohydrate porin [Acerihabitans sp. KWT182]|uniref:Carbohydrate porin n=1 Tax=Acerihabitans sp. KWT182 TaxID=3157919 RepID=A0AAU7QCH4_9GAMM
MKITIDILAVSILGFFIQNTTLAATVAPSAALPDSLADTTAVPDDTQAQPVATSSTSLPGALADTSAVPDDTQAQPAVKPTVNRESGTADHANALQKLAEQGVLLRANLINQYSRNTRGGVGQGHTNVGQFNIGADLDLDKLVGTHGSSFHFTVYKDYGTGLSHDVTGTFPKQQNIYKNEYPAWHLGLFAFEQKLLDDRLDVTVGRLGTTAYYAKLPTNCQFQTGDNCGVPRLINSESGYSLLPSATWAINMRYRTTPHTYVESGVYEVNPTTAASNGLDFSTSQATGVTVPLEWGWSQPGKFDLKVGGYVSTAPHTDPYYNTAGRSLGTYGGTADEANKERKGVYLLGDKVVWRPGADSPRNLAVFGGVVQQLEDEEIMKQQFLSGAVLTGPLAARPHDTIGFSASLFTLTDKEIAYLRDARAKAGGSGSNDPHEYSMELNYGWHVSPGIIVMPNIQYIIHPDNSGLAKTAVLPKNMLVYGLNLQISFGGMFGLSSPGGGD